MHKPELKKFKKSTIERYELSFDRWNYVSATIDPKGDISFTGDYGNYSYSWRHFGDQTFKEFFVGLNSGYLYGKFCKEDYFNFHDWKEKAFEGIKDDRRECLLNKEEARVVFDFINNLEEIDEIGYIGGKIWESAELSEIYCDIVYSNIFPQNTYSPTQIIFIEGVIPEFQKLLRKELLEEN